MFPNIPSSVDVQIRSEIPESNLKVSFTTFQSLRALMKTSPDWGWSYNETFREIYLTCIDPPFLADRAFLIKTVKIMDSQFILYHFRGKQVYLEGRPKKFSSYEHLIEIIMKLSDAKPCSPITQRSLKDVAIGSKVKFATNCSGDIVSPNCKHVADKGRHCVNCRNLVKSLRKRKIWLEKNNIQENVSHKSKEHSNLKDCRRQIATLLRKEQVFNSREIL